MVPPGHHSRETNDYLNGKPTAVAPATRELTTLGDSDGTVVIGRLLTDGNFGYSDSVVDDVAMWNRELTEEEVQQLYSSIEG